MKYLINGISHPLRVNRWLNCIRTDTLENNPGDMAYAYAVMNALSVSSDVQFEMTGYYRFAGYSSEKVSQINASFKAFVLPLADMFSHYWAGKVLPIYTSLIRQLTIPCVVPCVGARDGDTTTDDDSLVKSFINAVLDHSSVIGVRGESTGRYLRRLGYIEGRHYEIIGCPSIYANGSQLPSLVKRPLDGVSRIAYGLNKRCSELINRFVYDSTKRFKSSVCVFQYHGEFYDGFVNPNFGYSRSMPPYYAKICKEIFASGNGVFPLNRKPWLNLLASADLQLTTRIHGAIMGILAGTPSILVPFEARTRELAEYHGIPFIDPGRIGTNSKLEDFYNEIDFSSLQKAQDVNCPRFLDLMKRNGLTVQDGGAILDARLPKRYPDDFLRPLESCSWLAKNLREAKRLYGRGLNKAGRFLSGRRG